jgi:hypothetical protein
VYIQKFVLPIYELALMLPTMIIEPTIKIAHNYTSFYERVKSLLLLFLGSISLCGIFSMFSSEKENIGTFIIAISLAFGFIIAIKIYQNRIYIFSFYCDSQNVKICYLNGSQECSIETTLENTDINFRNTSSRAGFNCEIIFTVEKLDFVITKDFDWNFEEMKQLYKYVKLYKEEKITEKEKSVIHSIENYLEKHPF